MARKAESIRLPRQVVEELFRTSLSFTELVETLEVLVDKETVRRLKLGEEEYRKGKYLTASTKEEINAIFSS